MIQAQNRSIAVIKNRFQELINNGGPEVWEYQELDYLIDDFYNLFKLGEISEEELNAFRSKFGEAFSNETMQGFAFNKPHGYSGDFEIIERIYNNYTSRKKTLAKWDYYWQNHPAARAVRNRKEFFKKTLFELFDNKTASVLNLASGPCTELKEYLDENPQSNLSFECLDMDENAISYSKEKLNKYLDRIKFIKQNLFRFYPEKQYDLVWSAGLFDYFDDKAFLKIIERFKHALKPNGVLLIGNFDQRNRSKNYMEIFDWNLHHRTEDDLMKLGEKVFFENDYEISVLSEREKVNLFLKVKKIK